MALDMIPPAAAADFLATHGWGGGVISPVAGDASFRRYFRVSEPGRTAILMDAPPPEEDPTPFIGVARWLVDHGFAAPVIHAADLDTGLVLLEDFGDVQLRETLDGAPERAATLYGQAIDILVKLSAELPAELPAYDRATYQREAGLLTEWYCPAVGLSVDEDGYRAAWDAALAPVLAERDVVTVLRDFHSENLMVVGNGLGLLDFQDARAGNAAYDLVSLLQDARRDVSPEIEAAMLDYYRERTGAGEAFDHAYHVLGAQRNAKIIGIFTRLWKRDGKPRYPTLCPRVWGYLERDLAHPALAPVRAWFDANVPADKRGDPMVVA